MAYPCSCAGAPASAEHPGVTRGAVLSPGLAQLSQVCQPGSKVLGRVVLCGQHA